MRRLLWASDVNEKKAGGGGGYTVHSLKMQEALAAAGVSITRDRGDDFDLRRYV